MRWIAAIGLTGLALAGCDQTTNEDALADNAGAAAQDGVEPAADATGEQPQDAGSDDSVGQPTDEDPSDGGDGSDDGASGGGSDDQAGNGLPPAGAGLRFVGLWASNAANCENLAWRFTATRLQTPAGSVCNFDEVSKVGGGYDIAATCTAEGPPTEDSIEIRFAESAQAMLFESDAIADAGLVYCGRG